MMKLNNFLETYLAERPLFLSLIRAKEAELYQNFLPLKRPILDVGVGDGFFAKVVFGCYIDVGLDLKDSRIDEARKLGIYKKLLTYDGANIPLPSNSFSTVISNCVLEHVSDLKALLKEIHRVLRPNGIFLTTVMAKPWENHLYGAKIFGQFYKDWMRKQQIHKNLLTKNEWNSVFIDSDFKIKKIVGYLSPGVIQLIDICHYLSLPSLLSFRLTGKWVLWSNLTRYYPTDYFVKVLSEKLDNSRSGALFYVLGKKKWKKDTLLSSYVRS